jgi:type I restriction enzyme, S subunit
MLDNAARHYATHRTALAQLDALFASLQQRAFAGEL